MGKLINLSLIYSQKVKNLMQKKKKKKVTSAVEFVSYNLIRSKLLIIVKI